MPTSMTGLGIAEVHNDGYTVSVEIRSVNNRFLEISCRLPSFLSGRDRDVKEIVRKYVQRGKLYITIVIQNETGDGVDFGIDEVAIDTIHRLLTNLQLKAGVDEPLRLEHFLKFSEIFDVKRGLESTEETWDCVKATLCQALDDLKQMRRLEGKSLEKDMLQRIACLEKNLADVEKISRSNIPETMHRLKERLHTLLKDGELSEDRLNTEIILLTDKMDITEECVRLKSHHALFRHILDEESAVGKKLNFLLQEMNREVNTISSKASNADICHLVVVMKEEIEKLREQVQNLE